MLGGSLAELQMLSLGGANAAQGDIHAATAVAAPGFLRRGGDKLERHFHALGQTCLRADHMQDLGAELGGRRRLEVQQEALEIRLAPDKTLVLPIELEGVLLQV